MIIEGTVAMNPGERVSKKGTDYLAFTIQDGRARLFKILAFNALKDRLTKDRIAVPEPIIVHLKPFDSEAGKKKNGDLESYMLESYSLPERDPGAKERQKERDSYQEEVQALHRAEYAQMYKQGFRFIFKAGGWQWKPAIDCVKVDGQWEDKLEFCLRILGDSKVHELLKSLEIYKATVPLITTWRKALSDLVGLAAMVHTEGGGIVELEELRDQGTEIQKRENGNRRIEVRLQEGGSPVERSPVVRKRGSDSRIGETS